MTRDSKRPRGVVYWAFGFISAWAIAYPALAETTTLSCLGDLTGMVGSTPVGPTPWSGSIDIDYGASKISIPRLNITQVPAVITDREIEFQLKEANVSQVDSFGSVDRLSGALHVQLLKKGYGVEVYDARCRPATQKF